MKIFFKEMINLFDVQLTKIVVIKNNSFYSRKKKQLLFYLTSFAFHFRKES